MRALHKMIKWNWNLILKVLKVSSYLLTFVAIMKSSQLRHKCLNVTIIFVLLIICFKHFNNEKSEIENNQRR